MSTALRTYFRGADLVTLKADLAGTKSVYHYDAQGTTQSLTSSATGSVTETFASDAWGVTLKRTGSSINRHWYVGQGGYYRQPDQQADYVRMRWLSPTQSRWVSRDPLLSGEAAGYPRKGSTMMRSEDARSLASYSYVSNRPSSMIDPTGLSGCLDCLAAIRRAGWDDPNTCQHELNHPYAHCMGCCMLSQVDQNCASVVQSGQIAFQNQVGSPPWLHAIHGVWPITVFITKPSPTTVMQNRMRTLGCNSGSAAAKKGAKSQSDCDRACSAAWPNNSSNPYFAIWISNGVIQPITKTGDTYKHCGNGDRYIPPFNPLDDPSKCALNLCEPENYIGLP